MPLPHADLIIQNVFLVTFDADRTVIADGALAVAGGVIVALGPTADVTRAWTAERRIYASGCIATPGLVDAHFHTAQTMMRGMLSQLQRTRRLRVPTWREYYLPFEAALTPDDIELSGRLAYGTMLRTGTTTFLEAGGPHADRMAAAAVDTGIRGVVTESTMDGGSRIPASMIRSTEDAIAQNIAIADAYPRAADDSARVTGGMSLRQIITCSTELVTTVHAEAAKRGVTVHTHLVEGTYEIDFSLEQFGRRPIEHLIDLGVFDEHLHCAHSILVDDREISAFADRGASACHCPKGNYSIGPAPALRMWRRGVKVGLGTDGVGSFGTLDMFRVAMFARIGQQPIEGTTNHNRNAVGETEPLDMAIRGGAQAAGMAHAIGSLEVGRRADIVLVGTDGPDAAAYSSAESFLYECASGRDVRTVIVDGEVLVSDGELQNIDLDRVRAEAAVRQATLMERLS